MGLPLALGAVAGAQMLGSILQSGAMGDAADQQYLASLGAIGEQRRQFDTLQSNSAPYRQLGDASAFTLRQALGLGGMKTREQLIAELRAQHGPQMSDAEIATKADQMYMAQQGQAGEAMQSPLLRQFRVEDFLNDPVNQIQGTFMQDEARKAIERRAAAQGAWDSGGTLKALTRFGSDYGNQQAGASKNRFIADQTNTINRLTGASNMGQVSNAATGQAGMEMANQVGQNLVGAANARGAAGVGQAGAWSNGLNNTLNYWQNQQLLSRLGGQDYSSFGNPNTDWGMTGANNLNLNMG